MPTYLLAFFIGVVAGLRSMTAPALVSWAARAGWLHLEGTWLSFLGAAISPYVFTLFAVGELIADKLPKTPSRKAPLGFVTRIVSGAVSGAAIGQSTQNLGAGLIAGVLGAIAGTLGGYAFRTQLVRAIGGKDLPIALLEDVIAIAGGFFIVSRLA